MRTASLLAISWASCILLLEQQLVERRTPERHNARWLTHTNAVHWRIVCRKRTLMALNCCLCYAGYEMRHTLQCEPGSCIRSPSCVARASGDTSTCRRYTMLMLSLRQGWIINRAVSQGRASVCVCVCDNVGACALGDL